MALAHTKSEKAPITVIVVSVAVLLLSAVSDSTAQSLSKPVLVTIAVGNWMGPMTAIHVRCSRNYDATVLWWRVRRWEEYANFYLLYHDRSTMNTVVPARSTATSPEHLYKCKFKVNKGHECEYLVLSTVREEYGRLCGADAGGCKWVAKPDGMYFKAGNGTEKSRWAAPHCSKPDLRYLRSWNHA